MAQILISQSRPQFATVRYKVMDRAEKTPYPTGNIIHCRGDGCHGSAHASQSPSAVPSEERNPSRRREVLVVAGRGVKVIKTSGCLGTGRPAERIALLHTSDGGGGIRRQRAPDRPLGADSKAETDDHLRRIRSNPVHPPA